jgi:hypothetical protein
LREQMNPTIEKILTNVEQVPVTARILSTRCLSPFVGENYFLIAFSSITRVTICVT